MDHTTQLHALLQNKTAENKSENTIYQPVFFRLSINKDKKSLELLLEKKPYIKVNDTIFAQLKELVKSYHPTRSLTAEEIQTLTTEKLAGIHPDEYGVWVYYPWNDKLVHILDEEEFINLRTNRNRYKITEEERAILSTKKVGVIGLSVGQSVSLTMAMERIFGELRIADFDDLEITNLNRLRSGLHNMGLLKTVLVAREIAEIDPFLKVTCFHDGITDANMDQFLLENGKLDVLIDECDGVDIKLNCRIAAKKHQIPVLMEASDRATVDVERFDLEPNRPLLHGFIEHLDISNFGSLKTNEQRLPYILAFAGVETLSTRMKASAIEVGQTISTWPQLASAVTMGGGITADVCRRILLNSYTQSGRYFIDIEELIGNPKETAPAIPADPAPLSVTEMERLAAKVPLPAGDTIPEAVLRPIMEAAAAAPSPGNNQPWNWYTDGKALFLFDAPEKSFSFGNFRNMASNMSFGTAVENVLLRAKETGQNAEMQLFPLKQEGLYNPVAVFRFSAAPAAPKDGLAAYIATRHTNRKKGTGAPVADAVLQEMKASIAGIPGAAVTFLTDTADVAAAAEIAGKAEKLRMFIAHGHSDLFNKEVRWTPEEAEATKDGLDIRTLDLATRDVIGFRVIKDYNAVKLVKAWNKGEALENMSKNLIATAPVTGLITMPSFSPEDCVLAGRAAQRIWLTAARHQVAMQPLLASILHFARLNHGNGEGMEKDIQDEFKKLEGRFNYLFNLTGKEPMFLFRLFHADNPQVISTRLSVDDILKKK